MQLSCSRCHERIEAADGTEHLKCGRCGAEAGLEPDVATPFAMRLFGVSLLGAALVAMSGVILALRS